MKAEMYTIRDSKIDAYMKPFYAFNREMALRSIIECVNDESHGFSKSPEDYSLYYLGSFEDTTGKFETCPPEHVANLIDLAKRYDINHENDGE